MRGLETVAADAFDRRLLRDSARPLAVALSGGGDSAALTRLADAWARQAGRELILLHVDHRLQAASSGWADACEALADRLERPFRRLAWEGEKPMAGLPAAARAARHRLLADAARESGAAVILMGHTADDLAEAEAMRAAGATTPSPREWGPSPAWPEGRGVFLLRPLLRLRREKLREWLQARGEAWIDDPANQDLRYARSRARSAGPPAYAQPPDPPRLGLAADVAEAAGVLRLSRQAIAAAPADLRRLLALACVCAGGGDRHLSTARVARLAEAVLDERPFTATLAGARITADGDLRIAREAGEAARGGLAPLPLEPAVPAVWDGRYEFIAANPGYRVERLAGRQRRLSADARRPLLELPPEARGALPALINAASGVRCPVLQETPDVGVRWLVGERLRAASGLVDREGA